MASQRALNAQVFAKRWQQSEHVSHLRHHRREYLDNVALFLRHCCATWAHRQGWMAHEPVAPLQLPDAAGLAPAPNPPPKPRL